MTCVTDDGGLYIWREGRRKIVDGAHDAVGPHIGFHVSDSSCLQMSDFLVTDQPLKLLLKWLCD